VEVVVALLNAKATVDQAGEDGFTSIHAAAHKGHTRVLEVLLRGKATVDLADRHGFSPLHYATIDGNRHMVDVLLSAKANVDQALSWFHGSDCCRSRRP
jgi:ankyrin repeat protein